MGENTAIEWADHTFNPWIGCTKVSPACKNCYAENYATRYGRAKWGKGQPRSRTSESNWKKPVKWNKDAIKAKVNAKEKFQPPPPRPRVFCASLADWADEEVPEAWLDDLFELIDDCRHVDWLMLTKRVDRARQFLADRYGPQMPPHIWVGTTVEDQERADERIPILKEIPATVRFLSMEPLLGPVDLTPWLGGPFERSVIHWVIVGGESGAGARISRPDWFRSLRDQSVSVLVPFMFKQWGAWTESDTGAMIMLGKNKTGRLLDGRTYDGVPGISL